MAFCSKCGFELEGGDLICAKCGHEMISDEQGEFEQISKDKLIKELTEYRSALSLKRSYENRPGETEDDVLLDRKELKKHSFMKFYWRYLAFAPVVYFIFTVIFALIGMMAESLMLTLCSYFIGFGFTVIFLLIGRSNALKAQASANNEVEEYNKRVRDSRKESDDTSTMKEKLDKAQSIIDKYQDNIPVKYRNEASLSTIIKQLKITDAKTVDEVITKMK